MSDDTQSHSQLLFTYGPGAMMDLPDYAVIVSGLDRDGWSRNGATIQEPRLTDLLRQLDDSRASAQPSLRTPPVHDEDWAGDRSPAVQVRIFPEWFLCDVDPNDNSVGSGETRRRLVRFEDLAMTRGKLRHNKKPVNPIRFVAACKGGHLQDIDWRQLVHRGRDGSCRKPMAWVERGVSADPSDMAVACACGARITMTDLYKPGFLGSCSAFSPWLTPRRLPDEPCVEDLHLLPRAATNAYFPQTVSVISMPSSGDALTEAIEKHWANLRAWAENPAMSDLLMTLIRGTPDIAPDFTDFGDVDIAAAIARRREGTAVDGATSSPDPRVEEFDRLTADAATIGHNRTDSHLYAERLPLGDLTIPDSVKPLLTDVVRVHRLREVACLYGFTRIAAKPTALESELNEINLAVEGAPLAREISWYPTVEQFGEGVFLRFDSDHIDAWQQRSAVRVRLEKLREGEKLEAENRGLAKPDNLGPAYWAIHTLSHALMAELALDCGYPLSSLKERVYASKEGGQPRHGLLIYTATAGGQGTLGGLSHLAARVPTLLAAAIEKLSPCSNDPVCGEHEPGDRHDDRHLHGAACHACLLVPETSCEARNGRLDRVLLWRGRDEGLI